MSSHPSPASPAPEVHAAAPVLPANALVTAFAMARSLVAAGKLDQARGQLAALIASAPAYDEPWLQLLALDPMPAEEIGLLEGFLRHHPEHRFAPAFRARLQDMRIVRMLGDAGLGALDGHRSALRSMRLGDYLIMKQWVTLEQVEAALAEQRRLRASGVEVRLGTLLLMNGDLGPAQLAKAFAETEREGFGEFGNYIVRHNILTPEQVGQALARQAAIAADLDREYLRRLASYHKRRHTALFGLRSIPKRKPVPKLGEVLVSMGMLTRQQVEQILRERDTLFYTSFS